MIIYKQGNLLDSGCKVICHQVNCQGVMGSGIAKEIRNRFPTAYTEFRKSFLSGKGSSHKFPDWIIKTDETRIQNMPWVINDYAGKPMVVTEKIDGTSTTFGLRKEKKRKEKNSWFALAMFGKQHRLKSASTTTMSTIS